MKGMYYLLILIILFFSCKGKKKGSKIELSTEVKKDCFLRVDKRKREKLVWLGSANEFQTGPTQDFNFYFEIYRNDWKHWIFAYFKEGDVLIRVDDCFGKDLIIFQPIQGDDMNKFDYIFVEEDEQVLKSKISKVYLIRNGKEVVIELKNMKFREL